MIRWLTKLLPVAVIQKLSAEAMGSKWIKGEISVACHSRPSLAPGISLTTRCFLGNRDETLGKEDWTERRMVADRVDLACWQPIVEVQ
jgi:hypothetical protein